MSKKLFMGFALALALVGCSQEEELVNMSGEPLKDLTGEIVEAGSRTHLGSDGSVLWSEGDAISLFKKNGYHQKYTVREYNTSSTNFDYAGVSVNLNYTNNLHYAVYPFSEGHSISGSTLTLDLSSLATQSYTENTFENERAVMVAKSANTQLAFTNAYSLAEVQLKGQVNNVEGDDIFVTKIEISSATKALAGEATLNMTEDKPIAVFDDNGPKTITLNCGTNPKLTETATNFYILMPVYKFPAEDLTLKIFATVAGEAKEYAYNLPESEFIRSKKTTLLIPRINLEDWTGSTEAIIKIVENVADANAALQNNTGVDIANATGTEAITVPAKTAEEAAKEHTIDLSDATMPTDGTPVQITVEEGYASNHTVETLKVVVPEGATASDFTIFAPGTTVTLTTANGTVIETITAATANETLVISSGITVKNVIVQKGNVRLEDGAIIERITRSEDNPDKVTYVYCEGSVPEDVVTDKNVILLSADFIKISDTIYEVGSVAGLRIFGDAVNAGNSFERITIKLAKDLDLNNEQWTSIGTSEKPFQGTFSGCGYTIKNLQVVETEAKEGKAYVGFFGYAKNATIKDVTFENVNLNIACLDIDHSQGHIGAVAGSLEGKSTIENVTVKGDIKVEATLEANGASRVAVVAGGNSYGEVTMKNVHVQANEGSYLKANNNVGALAGQLQGKSVFENCSSNIDVTGYKFFAGGIIGLAAGDQLFTNCHTTGDVTITAGREGRIHDHYRVGGIAGGWADGATKVCTLEGCSYTGTISGTNADGSVAETLDYLGYVGRGYTLNGCQGSKVVIDGTEFIQKYNTAADAGIYTIKINGLTQVATADELVAALEAGEGVIFKNNIKIDPAAMSNAYGKTGINVKNGQTIDGNGHTLNIKGAGGTWDSGINTTGGLIKNITVTGSYRGIFINHTSTHSEKVVLNNVTIGGNGTVYTISCDQGLNQGIEATNCTFNGWTSFAKTAGEAKFINCSFGEGSGYKYCRPYSKTEFVNCTFCPGYTVDKSQAEVTFTNCTWEE